MTYATIDQRSQLASQIGFLHLLKAGPGIPTESTDVVGRGVSAQRWPWLRARIASAKGRITGSRFDRPDGGAVEIETTRPELLAACVALVAHPGGRAL